MEAPHVQLVTDSDPSGIPAPLQDALIRLNARVSIRSAGSILSRGLSPSIDVCVIVPSSNDSPDAIDRILAAASRSACSAMILPAPGYTETSPAAARIEQGLQALAVEDALDTAEEIAARIQALFEIRRPMLEMREELARLRRRDAELTSGAREHDEQLRLAAQLQRDLLPRPDLDTWPLSLTTLYLPADHVSGDIYEIARLDEDRFGFSLADATGHGLPAALLTILIRNSLRGKEIRGGTYRVIEPDDLLRRLNDDLLGSHLSQCQFITALHAVFDRTTREFRWSRGGAPYPILLRAGEAPRQLRTAGSLIGAVEEPQFEVASIRLRTGDAILLYTDGLESLLLGRDTICSDGAILAAPWLTELAEKGPEALAALRTRAENHDWPRDDVTAILIRL